MTSISRNGKAAVCILVAFAFVHADCTGFFNAVQPGPTITGAVEDPPSITTSSQLFQAVIISRPMRIPGMALGN